MISFLSLPPNGGERRIFLIPLSKLYSGFLDLLPEDIQPSRFASKFGSLRRDHSPTFKLDFVRDLDDELRSED